MEIKQCIFTNNDCYKKGQKIKPTYIIVHSTGVNNKNLKRYVQPDDGILGYNKNKNHWNKGGISKCVHGFLGLDSIGNVRFYQTLPWDIAAWGVGKGKKGSMNYNPAAIQFEICEDNLKDEVYFTKAFQLAIEVCAYLCKEFNIPVENVISHNEAYKKGYGSNHSDCDHWLKKFKKDMNWFRQEVKEELSSAEIAKKENFEIKYVSAEDGLNVRKGPGSGYAYVKTMKLGTKVQVYEIQGSWARIAENEWCSNNFLSKTKLLAKTVNAKNGLNVRNKASLIGKKIKTLKNGTKVIVYQTKSGWSKISKSKNEWVSSKYLK